MSALLAHLLFGDDSGGKTNDPATPGTEQTDPSQGEQTEDPGTEDPGTEDPGTEDPGTEDPGTEDPSGGQMPEDPVVDVPAKTNYEIAAQLPDGLKLNKTDYTTNTGDPAVQLVASGGSGTYEWISQDETVATVDSTGKVTALARGTIKILVTDGNKKATCIVRSNGPSGASVTTPPSTTTPSTPVVSNTDAKLNREDMTLSVGESFQMKLSGVTASLTWSIGNSNVATVSSGGVVKGVAPGTTTLKVTWNGQSRECIVRVK